MTDRSERVDGASERGGSGLAGPGLAGPGLAGPGVQGSPFAETDDGVPPAVAERRAERLVLLLFALSALAGVALLVVYLLGGQTQVEGVLLTICLGCLGSGVVVWGQRLMPARIEVEPRGRVASPPEDIEDISDSFQEAGFGRRKLLIGALGAALGGLGAALAIPVFSLGPAPGRSLHETTWRNGARLGTEAGPVVAATLPIGGVLTVFPDGDDTDPNAATLLIRVEPELLRLAPEAMALAPGGYVAYSKVCTHAGCPVGLYRAAQHTLICPCHQSEFDVLTGAPPISGPAVRALPQLPIRLEADGTFVALDDFPEPVGPSFWDMRR
jgi:ubiquinol-cytochrome c reductase iron-sulfur subunit